MQRALVMLFLLVVGSGAMAQPDTTEVRFYRKIGLTLNAGTIFAHTADVENTAGSVPFGFEVEYGRRNISADAWKLCHCYPSSGFVLGYTNYDNAVLGAGVHAAYFLEHRFWAFSRVSPVLRAAAGLSYSTNPWHPTRNPDNQSYSLPVNAFLQLQFGLNARISEHSMLTARLGYNHISNGGIKEPNKGINWPNIAVGYAFTPVYHEPMVRPRIQPEPDESKWMRTISIFGAYTTREFEEENRESFWTYGMMLSTARKLGHLHTLSGGVEWHYSQLLQRRILLEQSSASAHRAGLLVGHDFVFGKFVFSQQIGVYVLDQFRYNDPLYHRWSIAYVHPKGALWGVSLKAHRQIAEFVDFRIGWVW